MVSKFRSSVPLLEANYKVWLYLQVSNFFYGKMHISVAFAETSFVLKLRLLDLSIRLPEHFDLRVL